MKELIQFRILSNLTKRKCWGGVHTEERNIFKCIQKHLIGTKEAKKALKELIQKGFLIKQKKTYENHYSLNTAKKAEIHAYLENLHKSITIYQNRKI